MKTKITRIALDKLVSHPDSPNWMSRANFAKLVRNIERTGCCEPLAVRPHPDKAGFFQIINGRHRRDALEELGRETADAVVWNVDDTQTAVLLTTLNRLSGRDSLDKKLVLLRRLRRHMSIPELAKLVPQTRGQLERLMPHKPLPRPTLHDQNPSPIPLVFFVNETQQRAIEDALLLAGDPDSSADSAASPAVHPTGGSTRTARRAEALTCMAHLFVDLAQQAGRGIEAP
jgi:ParB/RepB/Spo0J family partition protein